MVIHYSPFTIFYPLIMYPVQRKAKPVEDVPGHPGADVVDAAVSGHGDTGQSITVSGHQNADVVEVLRDIDNRILPEHILRVI